MKRKQPTRGFPGRTAGQYYLLRVDSVTCLWQSFFSLRPLYGPWPRNFPPEGGIGVRGFCPCERRKCTFARCLHGLSPSPEGLISPCTAPLLSPKRYPVMPTAFVGSNKSGRRPCFRDTLHIVSFWVNSRRVLNIANTFPKGKIQFFKLFFAAMWKYRVNSSKIQISTGSWSFKKCSLLFGENGTRPIRYHFFGKDTLSGQIPIRFIWSENSSGKKIAIQPVSLSFPAQSISKPGEMIRPSRNTQFPAWRRCQKRPILLSPDSSFAPK